MTRQLIAFVVALVVAAPALLAAQGIPVSFIWELQGDELILVVEADEDVSDLALSVTPERGREVTFERSSLRASQVWREAIGAPAATTNYELLIAGDYADERGTLVYEFTVSVAEALSFDVDESTFDAAGRRFTLTMNQPADRVEILVRGESGNTIAERVIRFSGESAGTPLVITWTQADERTLTVDVKAVAESGAWASHQYIPWAVEFDAVHVNFASGSSDIPPTDEPMLRDRYTQVAATAERVAEFVQVELYVGGYTDTVGNGADNQSLSEARARALGRWFRDQGWTLPIYYQGFGESALAVATDDNVDEPANRRAIFILTTQTPPTSANIPRSSWRQLD